MGLTMARQRKSHSAEFKAWVALEAIKGQMTANQIARHYGVHSNQMLPWKQQAIKQLPGLFSRAPARAEIFQLHGGYAVVEEYPVCRPCREAAGLTIGAGTSEILSEIIAEQSGW